MFSDRILFYIYKYNLIRNCLRPVSESRSVFDYVTVLAEARAVSPKGKIARQGLVKLGKSVAQARDKARVGETKLV